MTAVAETDLKSGHRVSRVSISVDVLVPPNPIGFQTAPTGWAFAKVRAKAPSQGHFVSRQINRRNEMKHQRHFDPMTPRLRQVATILAMIDDLNRVAGHLDCDIAAQEIASPLLASLTSRRDRLRETLALLETRLADIRGFQG